MAPPCESSPPPSSAHPASTHKDAASALMALAGNAENESAEDDSGAMDTTSVNTEDNSPDSDASSPFPTAQNTSNTAAAAAAATISRFPNKLMSVLDSETYKHIITWSTDGKSFIFLDSNAFERVVLPSIFKVAKFDSFLRKLYRWGFSKCQTHSKVGCPAYKHEKFLRDNPDAISEMECRSKPKTQYGTAAPMTLNAFHQSAPQLSRNARDAAVFQNTISNAVWDQVRGINSQAMAAGSMDTEMGNDDATMMGHQNSQLSELESQQRILENARQALLTNASSQPSPVTSAAGQQFDVNNLSAVLQAQQRQQQLLNQQAASMGHSLIGGAGNPGVLFANQQVQGAGPTQSLSNRSKTTPFNMKFMEQQRSQSAQNSTFQLNQNQSLLNMDRNILSQLVLSQQQQGQAQNLASNTPPRNSNMFLDEVVSNNGLLGMQQAQNIASNMSNMLGVASAGQTQIEQSVAELQALQRAEQAAHANQALSGNPLLNGLNASTDNQALQLLRLTEERSRMSDEVQTRIHLQNEVERLQLQNHLGQQMGLQNNLGRQAQIQGEVNRLRLLNEVDRQLRAQNEAATQARLQNEARLALIAKLAREGNNGSQPFGR